MSRVWYKTIPPKKVQEEFSLYRGVWMPYLDRSWESDDGYTVMSRKIRTDWGTVEHVTIERMDGSSDVSWSVKQEIKDELFGFKSVAIEVFPAKKNLIDVCNVYHLWVLPDGFRIPFGIHPYRDVQCQHVERGYDYDMDVVREWVNSSERKMLLEKKELTPEQEERVSEVKGLIDGKTKEIHTLRS